MSKRKSDYEVGYGKPPRATRFKPGQSGNPAGRSKGSRNLATLVQEELSRAIPITIDGRRQTQPKGRVLARLQVDKALKGDTRAFLAVVNLEKAAVVHQAPAAASAPVQTTSDELSADKHEEIVRAFLDQLRPDRHGEEKP